MENSTLEKINEIRKQADIVDIISRHINVIRKGKSFTAICPFHNDTNPSLSISRDKQIFKCFVCNTGGNVFSFVSKYRHIPYMSAVKEVADMVGAEFELKEAKKEKIIDTRKKVLFDIAKEATNFYKNSLVGSKEAIEYAKDRNLDNKILQDFNIGYSPDFDKIIQYLEAKGFTKNDIFRSGIAVESDGKLKDRFARRLIFPITDLDGNIVGFSGRIIEQSDMAKYVNSPESDIFIKGNTLYNYYQALPEIKNQRKMYICEGFMDCIAMHRSGIQNTIALMGTAFTKEHLKIFKYLGVSITLCLDGDNPGISNANKLANELIEQNVSVNVIPGYEDVKDLGEYFDKYGPEKLQEYIKNSEMSPFDFEFFVAKKTNNLENNENKKEFLKKICKKISTFSNEDKDIYINKIHDELGFSLSTINSVLDSYKKKDAKNIVKDIKQYQKITKKQDLQLRILSSMLDSPEAIQTFIDSMVILEDDAYRKISLLIGEYYQENYDNFDINNMIADLYTKVSTEQNDEESKLQDALLFVGDIKDKYPPYNKLSFSNMIYEVMEISPLEDKLESLNEQLKFATDDQEKKSILHDYIYLANVIKEKKKNMANIYEQEDR